MRFGSGLTMKYPVPRTIQTTIRGVVFSRDGRSGSRPGGFGFDRSLALRRQVHAMPRFIAFLRGINVGGHRIKMEALRRHFEVLELENVTTFIASGNVIFDSPATAAALAQRLEKHLATVLGYETPTLLRTLPELAAVAAFPAFPKTGADDSLYVYFLRSAPDADQQRAIGALTSDVDDFRIHGRELYWRCRGKISQVSIAWPKLEKLMKSVAATSRNLATVRQLAAQYGAAKT